jgi:hypothetical protein
MTKPVFCGKIQIGGGAFSVQSCYYKTTDINALFQKLMPGFGWMRYYTACCA